MDDASIQSQHGDSAGTQSSQARSAAAGGNGERGAPDPYHEGGHDAPDHEGGHDAPDPYHEGGHDKPDPYHEGERLVPDPYHE
jgi:hypothetical protein